MTTTDKSIHEVGSVANDSFERIILENESMRVEVIPALGGKIASIRLLPEHEELLQQPLQPYALRTPYMNFDASDASGWDECLPSVAACHVQTSWGTVQIPDHGDFWQMAWNVNAQGADEVTLSAHGISLPLHFKKTLRLDEAGLQIHYSVMNMGAETVDYIWSAHPLFAVDAGDRIVLPESVKAVTVEGSGHNRLGRQGDKLSWPLHLQADGTSYDLSQAGNLADGTGDKLFAASPAEGWCALERVRLKRRVEVHFDPLKSPFLGLWLCYGGWPDAGVQKQYCVALEPCTAIGDSLEIAMRERRASQLASGNEDHWSVTVQVSGNMESL